MVSGQRKTWHWHKDLVQKSNKKKKNDKIYKLISLSLSMQLTYCYLSEPERRDREAHNEQNLEKKQGMAEEAWNQIEHYKSECFFD